MNVFRIVALSGCLLSIALTSPSATAQPGQPPAPPAIYGRVVDQNGQPAIGITLEARPMDGILATALPETITDRDGNYRFEHLFGWGKYTIYANDPKAGYSDTSLDPDSIAQPHVVFVSAENPQARFDFSLPPKAGLLFFHLTNQKTGALIDEVEVAVEFAGNPRRSLFSGSHGTNEPFLVPPNRDLLIHVKSRGYKEWFISVGMGKPIRLTPGERMDFDIALEPENAPADH